MTQHQKQPYDSSLKSFLREQTAEILPYLLPNTEYVRELPTEIFKPQPPLRADKLCLVRRNGKERVLHFELETGANKRMAYRMLAYSGLLMEEYENIPVTSIIIYPFRTTAPTSPLVIDEDEDTMIVFKFKVVKLWEFEAQQYMRDHILSMYPLLPTMNGANATLLIRVIQEMREYYQGEKLPSRLFWFRTLLRRVKTIPLNEKESVEKELHMFEDLLDDDPYIQEREERAEIHGWQEAVVTMITHRYPDLADVAKQTIPKISELAAIRLLTTQISNAADENFVRTLLDMSAA